MKSISGKDFRKLSSATDGRYCAFKVATTFTEKRRVISESHYLLMAIRLLRRVCCATSWRWPGLLKKTF